MSNIIKIFVESRNEVLYVGLGLIFLTLIATWDRIDYGNQRYEQGVKDGVEAALDTVGKMLNNSDSKPKVSLETKSDTVVYYLKFKSVITQ